MKTRKKIYCPICGNSGLRLVFEYTSPPKGETRFKFSSDQVYYRKILQCNMCGHFISMHDMNITALYSGDYVNATYREEEGLYESYKKIMNLDPERSDNVRRVRRILDFSNTFFSGDVPPHRIRKVLDIGSGLCVFLKRMKDAGWDSTAIDPDGRAISHAIHHVGVKGFCGDFMVLQSEEKYDLITFNKVLEHVSDPVKMLSKAVSNSSPGGLIYIEVPDGEVAAAQGKERQEFFIDHPNIFSFSSLSLMMMRAGLLPLCIERIKEPSSKYTLLAFGRVCG